MTLNDIIRRDLEFCRREEEAEAARRGLEAYERNIKRRLWRQRFKAILKPLMVAAVIVAIFYVVM